MGKRRGRRPHNKKWKQFNAVQVFDDVRSDRLHAKQKAALERDSVENSQNGSALFVWHLLSRPTFVPAKQIHEFFSRFSPTVQTRYINHNKACRVVFEDANAATVILSQTRDWNGKRRLDTPRSPVGYQGFVLISEFPSQDLTPTTVQKNKTGRNQIEASFVAMGTCESPLAGTDAATFSEEFRKRSMTLNFNFKKRCLQWGCDEALYELRFKHILDRICAVHDVNGQGDLGLLINFKHAPLVFRARPPPEHALRLLFNLSVDGGSFEYPPEQSEVDIFTDDQKERDEKWQRCGDPTPKNSLQRCNAVLLVLSPASATKLLSNNSLLRALVNYSLLPAIQEAGHPHEPVAIMRKNKEKEIDSVVSILHRELERMPRRAGHAARAVFDARVLSPWTLGADIQRCFALLKHSPPESVEKTLWMLQASSRPLGAKAIEQLQSFLAADEDEGAEKVAGEREAEESLPSFLVQLPRMLVTPTRMLLLPAEAEVSNRMVRHLMQEGFDELDFVRVAFGEEDGGRFLRATSSSQALYDRVELLASEGIDINGRKYEFLGYSSSQLKELGMWFLHFGAARRRWTRERVWEWIGDLDAIRLPSKFAARMGQAFSTTVSTVPLTTAAGSPLRVRQAAPRAQLETSAEAFNVDVDDDVERNGMVFTDGSGTISRAQLDACLRQLPFSPDDPPDVGIVQVRIGGAKGTLLLDPTLPRMQGERAVHCVLRKSMIKFQADIRTVEVVSFGKQLPYYLNQSLVAMLETQGVPYRVFAELQDRQLRTLDSLMQSATMAAFSLPRVMDGSHFLFRRLAQMLAADLQPCQEPFLFSCLSSIRSHQVQRIRRKANIFVEQGTVLMGAPSDLVPEGKVFFQIRRRAQDGACRLGAPFSVVTGQVLIAKHPVYHPGDVRMLTAIDIPALRSIRNVILFSTHGSRPEADKLSGSDYDGDLFSVAWNPDLFLPAGNHPPMDYSPPPAPPAVDKIEPEHLVKHFINHAENDNIGRIANAIIAIGDQSPTQQRDVRCCELAQLASMAVDFPKSGVPAILQDKVHLIPKTFPHFMQKKNKLSYHSQRALGKLFDQVSTYERNLARAERQAPAAMERWIEHGRLSVVSGGNLEQCMQAVLDSRIVGRCYNLFGLPDPRPNAQLGEEEARAGASLLSTLQSTAFGAEVWWTAVQNRAECERSLKEMMNKYHVHCEGELLTGFIRKFHRLHKRRQHDLSEQLRTEVRETCSLVRRSFLIAAAELTQTTMHADVEGGEDDSEDAFSKMSTEDLEQWGGEGSLLVRRQLAICCYLCTYHPQSRAAVDEDLLLFSFPWISAAEELCSLVRRAEAGTGSELHTARTE